MRAVLSQADLDDALDKFRNKDSKSCSDEEKRRDRKALSQIHLHLSNNILQEVLQEKTAAALWLKLESICLSKDLTSKMHLKMKLFLHKLQDGGSVQNHLTVFKEIVSDLQAMEVKYEDEDSGSPQTSSKLSRFGQNSMSSSRSNERPASNRARKTESDGASLAASFSRALNCAACCCCCCCCCKCCWCLMCLLFGCVDETRCPRLDRPWWLEEDIIGCGCC